MNNFTLFYRGAKTKEFNKGNTRGLWVTEDRQYAKMYGKLQRYKVKNDINILNIWVDEAEELLEEFFRNDINTDDIWYNPNNEFIDFLERKGYDGFLNNQNLLLFNPKRNIKCKN